MAISDPIAPEPTADQCAIDTMFALQEDANDEVELLLDLRNRSI